MDAACVLADLSYSFLSPSCAPPGEEDSPAWLEVLAQVSLTITTLFLVEIPLTLWALGVQYVNPFGPVAHAGLHAFDSLIILTTFILEFVLRGKEQELAGLLVILRLWRLVKLVGGASSVPLLAAFMLTRVIGVAVGTSELEEDNAERLAETQKELAEVRAQLAESQSENARLRSQLGW